MNRASLKILLVALLALGIVLAPTLSWATPDMPNTPTKDESLRKGETRDTLNPAMFPDPKVRAAYSVAKAIPWVLDSIYCYCYCHENPHFRHISLLSCYVDRHAST